VSVTASLVLPNQPAVGVVADTPLGGDGWSAPHSSQEVSFSLVGDASGGTMSLRVHTDPRWASVVSHITLRKSSAAADWTWALQVFPDRQAMCQITGTKVALALASASDSVLWCPPPLIGTTGQDGTSASDPFFIFATCVNVDVTETLTMNIKIYNFRKTVRERVPLSVILASLPRSSSVFN